MPPPLEYDPVKCNGCGGVLNPHWYGQGVWGSGLWDGWVIGMLGWMGGVGGVDQI